MTQSPNQAVQDAILAAIDDPASHFSLPKQLVNDSDYWSRLLLRVADRRLEFVGDGLMHACIGLQLQSSLPHACTGTYTAIKSRLVSNVTFARLCQRLDFPGASTASAALILAFEVEGKPNNSKQYNKRYKKLANLFETFIGLFYMERRFEELYKWVTELYRTLIDVAVKAYYGYLTSFPVQIGVKRKHFSEMENDIDFDRPVKKSKNGGTLGSKQLLEIMVLRRYLTSQADHKYVNDHHGADVSGSANEEVEGKENETDEDEDEDEGESEDEDEDGDESEGEESSRCQTKAKVEMKAVMDVHFNESSKKVTSEDETDNGDSVEDDSSEESPTEGKHAFENCEDIGDDSEDSSDEESSSSAPSPSHQVFREIRPLPKRYTLAQKNGTNDSESSSGMKAVTVDCGFAESSEAEATDSQDNDDERFSESSKKKVTNEDESDSEDSEEDDSSEESPTEGKHAFENCQGIGDDSSDEESPSEAPLPSHQVFRKIRPLPKRYTLAQKNDTSDGEFSLKPSSDESSSAATSRSSSPSHSSSSSE